MSEQDARPVLRVVSGNASEDDIAVLTALMAASGSDERPVERERRGGWNDPAAQHRRPLRHGPNGWRAAAW